MLDDRTAADRDLDEVRHKLWDDRSNRVGWRAYLGIEPGADSVPAYAVPGRRADLSGLPPAFESIRARTALAVACRTRAERWLAGRFADAGTSNGLPS